MLALHFKQIELLLYHLLYIQDINNLTYILFIYTQMCTDTYNLPQTEKSVLPISAPCIKTCISVPQ